MIDADVLCDLSLSFVSHLMLTDVLIFFWSGVVRNNGSQLWLPVSGSGWLFWAVSCK